MGEFAVHIQCTLCTVCAPIKISLLYSASLLFIVELKVEGPARTSLKSLSFCSKIIYFQLLLTVL